MTPPDLAVPGDVWRAGRVLARAHQALRDFPAGSDPRYRWPWEWITRCLESIAMPEHVSAGGAQDALIDWTTTLRGPLLYDLACFAVITSQAGPQVARWFTEGYTAQMPEIAPQLSHRDCLVKTRWLANAIYFSSRIERGIVRGSDSPTANYDRLAAAYAGMTAGA
jgi:Ser/Thr protein kinase RdoA (MazF antagonist)